MTQSMRIVFMVTSQNGTYMRISVHVSNVTGVIIVYCDIQVLR